MLTVGTHTAAAMSRLSKPLPGPPPAPCSTSSPRECPNPGTGRVKGYSAGGGCLHPHHSRVSNPIKPRWLDVNANHPHKRCPTKPPRGAGGGCWRLQSPLMWLRWWVMTCVIVPSSLSPFCPSGVLHPGGNCCRMVPAEEVGRGQWGPLGPPSLPAQGCVPQSHPSRLWHWFVMGKLRQAGKPPAPNPSPSQKLGGLLWHSWDSQVHLGLAPGTSGRCCSTSRGVQKHREGVPGTLEQAPWRIRDIGVTCLEWGSLAHLAGSPVRLGVFLAHREGSSATSGWLP